MYCYFLHFLQEGNSRGEHGVDEEHPAALIVREKDGNGILHSENSICRLMLQNLKNTAEFQSNLSAYLNTSVLER